MSMLKKQNFISKKIFAKYSRLRKPISAAKYSIENWFMVPTMQWFLLQGYKAISESGVLPFWIFKMEVDCPVCTKRSFVFWHFQRNREISAGKQYSILCNIELRTKICILLCKMLVRDISLVEGTLRTFSPVWYVIKSLTGFDIRWKSTRQFSQLKHFLTINFIYLLYLLIVGVKVLKIINFSTTKN